MGIGVEREVGDAHRAFPEPFRFAEMALHDRERGPSALLPVRKLGALQLRHLEMLNPVTRDRDARLMAVLLEEHPLEDESAGQPFGRQKRGALGEVEQDRVRLGDAGPVLELEHRDAPVCVLREELRRVRLALQDVDLDAFVGLPEVREEQARLVSVAGQVVVVETKHRRILVELSDVQNTTVGRRTRHGASGARAGRTRAGRRSVSSGREVGTDVHGVH